MQILEWVEHRLLAMPVVAQWPEMVVLVKRLRKARSMSCLEYPLLVARSIGADESRALPAVAAAFCALTSINLVDDLLDEDPRGDHHVWGEGVAANLALAFQAVALEVLNEGAITDENRNAAMVALSSMMARTARGQHLDLADFDSEAQYWALVDTKTAPLFACTLQLGALFTGAEADVSQRLKAIGQFLGKIVQINDDVADALEKPAKPDWRRGSANLTILFASIADHPDREAFLQHLDRIQDPERLDEAQRILVRSGAISYCFYQVVQAYRQAKDYLRDEVQVAHPQVLHELLEVHLHPLKALLKRLNIEPPEELISL